MSAISFKKPALLLSKASYLFFSLLINNLSASQPREFLEKEWQKESELVEFEVLTQPCLLRIEPFIEAKKVINLSTQELDEHTQQQAKAFIKYFKLWPSFLPSLGDNEDLNNAAAKKLTDLFYTHPLRDIIEDNDFLETKINLYFAVAIKPFNDDLHHAQTLAARSGLKGFLFKENAISDQVSVEVLYWVWKHRDCFNFEEMNQLKPVVLLQMASKSYPKAQYALAQLYERGVGVNKDLREAKSLYQKSANGGYGLAQLYLDFLALERLRGDAREEALSTFYQRAADLRFPYAQYRVGKKLLSILEISQEGEDIPDSLKKGLIYLLSAAKQGLPQAQETLNKIRKNHKEDFYLWCRSLDGLSDSARLKEFKDKAQQGIAPYAYQLAQMCEDGRGLPYSTSLEWLRAFEEAKKWYEAASLYNIEGAKEGVERVQHKIDLLKKAQGYILNKIRKGITVSFTPQHPLFDVFSEFISELHKYSPGARYLGTCIIQQLIEESISEEKAGSIIEELLEQIKSKEFQAAFTEELNEERGEIRLYEEIGANKEVEEATQLFEALLKRAQFSQEKQSQTVKFLTRSKGFIFFKIEKGIAQDVEKGHAQALSPSHPLFEELCEFIEELQRYPGSVPEHGAHLVQQLLYFPPHSTQAKVLIDGLLELIRSSKFKEGAEDYTQEDLDEYRVHKLSKLNKAIELTVKHYPLLSPIKEEEKGGIPEKLVVNKDFLSDPRIKVYNYHFEEDNKPFDQGQFNQAVQTILSRYDYLHKEGKITKEMLKDDESPSKEPEYGSRETLEKLLTYEGTPNNKYGHRIIKICEVLTGEGAINANKVSLDNDTLAAQLASWAVAGLHCKTRAEGETHKFYIANITDGKRLEREDITLEAKVAIALAELRRKLLEKMVPTGEFERQHPVSYLEKKAGKVLGLIDPQSFEDPHKKIIKDRYKNITPQNIKAAILTGNTGYPSDLIPDEGYINPKVLINHILSVINNKDRPSITPESIIERFKKPYKVNDSKEFYNPSIEEAVNCAAEYYDEDMLQMTEQGARALLLSLGYLEKQI